MPSILVQSKQNAMKETINLPTVFNAGQEGEELFVSPTSDVPCHRTVLAARQTLDFGGAAGSDDLLITEAYLGHWKT